MFFALFLLAACASGRRSAADANHALDATIGEPDAALNKPDAALSKPDAALSKPDAIVSEPDAALSEPDAALSEPDAAVSEPDAAVSEPDASSPNPVAPSALVINEIEVNNPGDDFEEFVEVLNRSGAKVELRGVELVHINGASNNPELGRWTLASATREDGSPVSSLATDEILVLAQQGSAVLSNLPSGAARIVHTTPLQNGPDIFQIVDNEGTLIDAVVYGKDVAGYGEGESAQSDLGDDRGLSRCPAGADTNDNSVDFVRATLTPATTNSCP